MLIPVSAEELLHSLSAQPRLLLGLWGLLCYVHAVVVLYGTFHRPARFLDGRDRAHAELAKTSANITRSEIHEPALIAGEREVHEPYLEAHHGELLWDAVYDGSKLGDLLSLRTTELVHPGPQALPSQVTVW